VLDGVTVAAPRGSVTAVVGGDGSGKSTLLRALAGLVPPDGGAVHSPARHDLGFVSTSGGAYRDLTVAENLAFAGRAYGIPAARLAERAGLLLSRTGLLAARDRLGGQLSGGMRRKLAVAMALLHEPPLLILDEPTTGLDPVSRVDLWRLFSGAAAAGTAVLLSTTYLDEAERAASVCVLDRGRTLLSGAPDDVAATVRGRVYTMPVELPRPDCPSWREGPSWRMVVADGCKAPAGAGAVTATLADAAIAAALGVTAGRGPALPPGARA